MYVLLGTAYSYFGSVKEKLYCSAG